MMNSISQAEKYPEISGPASGGSADGAKVPGTPTCPKIKRPRQRGDADGALVSGPPSGGRDANRTSPRTLPGPTGGKKTPHFLCGVYILRLLFRAFLFWTAFPEYSDHLFVSSRLCRSDGRKPFAVVGSDVGTCSY